SIALNTNCFPFIFSHQLNIESEIKYLYIILAPCFIYCSKWFRVFYLDFCNEKLSYLNNFKKILLLKILFISPILAFVIVSLGILVIKIIFDFTISTQMFLELTLLAIS